jgi:hypothetical protein
MTVKGLRLSTLCWFILELRRRPIICRPLSSLAVIVRSLPCVALSAACSPHVVSRRPPVQQHRRQYCHCVLLLPPRSLVARRLSCRTPPPLAAANRSSSSSQTTLLLLSSVFSFAPSLALPTVRFDVVPSAPGHGLPPLCPLLLPGRRNGCPPSLDVVVDRLAANPTGGDSDCRMLGRSTPSGGSANACPLLLLTTRQLDHLTLSVIVGHLSTNKADGDGGGGRCHTTAARLSAANCCPPSAWASADNTTLPPLPQMKRHYRHCRQLHVIVAAVRAKEH